MERTCLVTKTKTSPDKLLRFTIHDGVLVFDGAQKQPGRGGYVLRDVQALEKLPQMRKKIAYFLRVKTFEIPVSSLEMVKSRL